MQQYITSHESRKIQASEGQYKKEKPLVLKVEQHPTEMLWGQQREHSCEEGACTPTVQGAVLGCDTLAAFPHVFLAIQ